MNSFEHGGARGRNVLHIARGAHRGCTCGLIDFGRVLQLARETSVSISIAQRARLKTGSQRGQGGGQVLICIQNPYQHFHNSSSVSTSGLTLKILFIYQILSRREM